MTKEGDRKQAKFKVGDEVDYKLYSIGGYDATPGQGTVVDTLIEYSIQPKDTTGSLPRQWREEEHVSLHTPSLFEACLAYRKYLDDNGPVSLLISIRKDLLEALKQEELKCREPQ